MNYITIDGGTSSTRISLVADKEIIKTIKPNVGVKDNITDPYALKSAIRDGIATLLKEYCEYKIERILASGMITSERGLVNLDHIAAPAGICELKKSSYEVVMKDICDIPFVFVRGVKTEDENIEKCDMMRGEETELMGILEDECEAMYILPGSHSKLIEVNKKGQICKFSTMLSGEMIAALSQHTILKDAVNLNEAQTDDEYLKLGYEYCKKQGINDALFKVRVLKNISKRSSLQVYSFFVGVILCSEIERIINSDTKRVVIGGRAQIKEATGKLLKAFCEKEIIVLDDEAVAKSTAMGLVKIYEKQL